MSNKLAILTGQGAAEVTIDRAGLAIGREVANDVVVDDPLVSRQHARIEARLNLTWIVDLKSRNGTFVNGQRVRVSLLSEGDVIHIGNSVARLVPGSAAQWQLSAPLELEKIRA